MRWSQRVRAWGGTVVAVLVSLACGILFRSMLHTGSPSVVFADKSAEAKTDPVEVKAMTVDGKEVGVITVNDREVLRLTTTLAGLSPLERANIVARRVNTAVAGGIAPADIQAKQMNGMWSVTAANKVLVTADPEEARRGGTTPAAQARTWADSLSKSLEKQHVSSDQAGSQHAATVWKPEEPYDDKWVPIVSALEGLKLGVARVNGPRSKVKLVQAVAQIETHFKDFVEIDVYLPISTNVPGEKLDIVKGAAVTGLGDIEL